MKVMRPICYGGTDCFMICFDLMQPIQLENACSAWIAEVKNTAKECAYILVGCKLDLRDEFIREVERTGDRERL